MHEYMGVTATTSNESILTAAEGTGLGVDREDGSIYGRGRIEGEHIFLYAYQGKEPNGEALVVALCKLDCVWLDIYRVNSD